MRNREEFSRPRRLSSVFWLGLVAASLWALSAHLPAQEVSDEKPKPDPLAELRERQAKVHEVVRKVRPATVAITNPARQGTGSGVIIDKSGLILTAAHVTQATKDELVIIFQDGTEKRGKALGANRAIDAGMAMLTDEPPSEDGWPVAEMGESDLIERGKWCVALGHPGGFDEKRKSPVRVGRIWQMDRRGAVFSDCTLIGGDSGGPLLDLDGRVIGIHSSIGASVAANRHVPIDSFREFWDRMKGGETWGELRLQGRDPEAPTLGVVFDLYSREGALVQEVIPNTPAADAGFKIGDRITRFNGHDIIAYPTLQRKISTVELGEEVPVTVRRGGAEVELKVTLASHKEVLKRSRQTPKEPRKEDGAGDEKSDGSEAEAVEGQPYLGIEATKAEGGGVRIDEVFPGSPAAEAGLEQGDIIHRVEGTDIDSVGGLADLIGGLKPGDSIKLFRQRGDGERELELELGELP